MKPLSLTPHGLVLLALALLGHSAAIAQTAVPAPSSAAPAGIPSLFIYGDSTANSPAPIQGWGTPIANYFDPAKVRVVNKGHGGASSHSFYDTYWADDLKEPKPGDYALLVFGINDGTTPNGLGDEVNAQNVHTYGWYMAQMATDFIAKGGHVYLLTVTARDIWTNPRAKFNDATITSQDPGYDPKEDKIERGTGNGRYTQWTKDIGAKLHIPVLDLTNLLADQYEKVGRETVMVNYKDHNHTFPAGADIVAASIVSGLKAFKHSPFTALLSDKGRAVETSDVKYVAENLPVNKDQPAEAKPADVKPADSATPAPAAASALAK